MQHRGDSDCGLGMAAGRVVTRPLAEWTFRQFIVRMDEAFKRDLRICRNGKPCPWHVDDFDGLAEDSTRGLDFVLAVRDFQSRLHEHRGLHATVQANRARLSRAVIFAYD